MTGPEHLAWNDVTLGVTSHHKYHHTEMMLLVVKKYADINDGDDHDKAVDVESKSHIG